MKNQLIALLVIALMVWIVVGWIGILVPFMSPIIYLTVITILCMGLALALQTPR